MYRKCVTEISVQHQKQVEEALLELMQKLPYEDITVTQLCQAANISRRVFYHLFNSKADALYALIDHSILAAEGYRTDIPDEAVRFFQYWKEHESLLTALTENGLSNMLLERMVNVIMNEDYDIRRWLRTENAANGTEILIFNLCGAMGLTYNWYYSGYRKSPEEMAALLIKLVHTPFPAQTDAK